jgi:hypothetical protein
MRNEGILNIQIYREFRNFIIFHIKNYKKYFTVINLSFLITFDAYIQLLDY